MARFITAQAARWRTQEGINEFLINGMDRYINYINNRIIVESAKGNEELRIDWSDKKSHTLFHDITKPFLEKIVNELRDNGYTVSWNIDLVTIAGIYSYLDISWRPVPVIEFNNTVVKKQPWYKFWRKS